MTTTEFQPDVSQEAIQRISERAAALTRELRKVVIGQDHALEQLLITLFAGGHCVLRGPPGSGKKFAVETLGRLIGAKAIRISCTPDLSPADITDTPTPIENRLFVQHESAFVEGPILFNVVLAHEINCAPYRTQNAFLQILQDERVSFAGTMQPHQSPFFLVATINPADESDGLSLSDSLSHRFLMAIPFPAPDADDERRIFEAVWETEAEVPQILESSEVLAIQKMVRQITATKRTLDYARNLASATRFDHPNCPSVLRGWIEQGAGPEAAACMIIAAKARALLKGRCAVHPADIRAVLPSVLLHRLRLRRSAILKGITREQVAGWLIDCVPDHGYDEPDDVVPELEVIDEASYLPPTLELLPQLDVDEPSTWPLIRSGARESPYELRNPM